MFSKKHITRLTTALCLMGACTLPYAVQAATVPMPPLALAAPTATTPVVLSAIAEIKTLMTTGNIELAEGSELLEVVEFEADETLGTH